MEARDTDEARSILAELTPLLFEFLAADEWGRLLVIMEPDPDGDGHALSDLQIEDVTGDGARIEQAMRGTEAFPVLPVLVAACEALCALEGVELGNVGGGTLVRKHDERAFVFLPGLVRTPSEGFEVLCAERVGAAMARQRELSERLKIRDQFEIDLRGGTITFLDEEGRPVSRAAVALLGSFSDQTRTWAWAWGNDSLPPELRQPSREACDAFPRRDLWELTTPQFAADLGTAWELTAVLAVESGAEGFYRIPQGHRHVFVLLGETTLLAG